MGAGLEKTSPTILTCLAHLGLDIDCILMPAVYIGLLTVDVVVEVVDTRRAQRALPIAAESFSTLRLQCVHLSTNNKITSPTTSNPTFAHLPLTPAAIMAKKGIVYIPSPSTPYSHSSPYAHTQQLTTCSSTAKSRTIAVRLISMALTGYYRTLRRPRVHRPLSMLKYDPVGTLEFSLPTIDAEEGLGRGGGGGRSNGCSG